MKVHWKISYLVRFLWEPRHWQGCGIPELICCSDGEHWLLSNDEEVGPLAQGLGADSDMPTGTNTFWFITFDEVPADAQVATVRVVVADHPEKPQPCCVCWVGSWQFDQLP